MTATTDRPITTSDSLNGSANGSTAQLITRAADQVSRLVKDEIALAKAEMAAKGKAMGAGVGMFAGAGFIALYGLGAGVATGIIALALVLPLWLSALLVTVFLFLVAGVLVLAGRASLKRAQPMKPVETIASVQADLEVLKERDHS